MIRWGRHRHPGRLTSLAHATVGPISRTSSWVGRLGVRKKLLYLIVLTMLTIGLTSCSEPDYHDLQGNQGRFADLQGKWILINYWAVWCQPCREEIPELNALSAQLADSLVVFGVNFDAVSVDEMVLQSEALGIEFAVLRDDPAVALGYSRPELLPTTYLFDPRGKLVHVLQGRQTQESIISAIEENK